MFRVITSYPRGGRLLKGRWGDRLILLTCRLIDLLQQRVAAICRLLCSGLMENQNKARNLQTIKFSGTSYFTIFAPGPLAKEMIYNSEKWPGKLDNSKLRFSSYFFKIVLAPDRTSKISWFKSQLYCITKRKSEKIPI